MRALYFTVFHYSVETEMWLPKAVIVIREQIVFDGESDTFFRNWNFSFSGAMKTTMMITVGRNISDASFPLTFIMLISIHCPCSFHDHVVSSSSSSIINVAGLAS